MERLTHPFDRFVEELRGRGLLKGSGCRDLERSARARCPAHSDRRASLSLTRAEDKVLFRCFAGCDSADVLASLGFGWTDTFSRSRGGSRAPEIVAAYEYTTCEGALIARKLRYRDKTFRWQRPGKQAGDRIWNLHGTAPGLYRVAELIDAPQVFVCEGEKSVDFLWALGIPATCGPSGAATWLPAWSRDLASSGCRHLVILPDADVPGDAHAERVAQVTTAEVGDVVGVTILRLPGLQRGADVFDWLRDEQTAAMLLSLARDTPAWFPGAKEDARRERKRAQNAERQRRFRARPWMQIVRSSVSKQSAVA